MNPVERTIRKASQLRALSRRLKGVRVRRLPGLGTLEYWHNGRWYVGQLVDVPAVISHGASLDALEAGIRDALAELTAARLNARARRRRPRPPAPR